MEIDIIFNKYDILLVNSIFRRVFVVDSVVGVILVFEEIDY